MKVVAARVATLFKHREEGLENSRVTLNGSAQAELTEKPLAPPGCLL